MTEIKTIRFLSIIGCLLAGWLLRAAPGKLRLMKKGLACRK